MKIVTLLQTYNEERFIDGCLSHLAQHGIAVYVVDNDSTDETVSIAERHLTDNVIGIERLPRDGHFSLHRQLERKEELARSLDADWFMHQDADELRVTPDAGVALAEAIADADAAGYNAVNFLEFAFLPTREAPDHDNPRFADTMRSYYPILPRFPHRLNAWKRQPDGVELASSGGHVVRFAGLRMSPRSLYSRHYMFLSLTHAAEKYGHRRFAPDEMARGWHAWRANVDPSTLRLPSERDLRTYVADHLLDPSDPRIHVGELLGRPPERPARGRSRKWLRRATARAAAVRRAPRAGKSAGVRSPAERQ